MTAGSLIMIIMTIRPGTVEKHHAMVATTGWMVYGEHFSHSLPLSLPGLGHAKRFPKHLLFFIEFKLHL